MMQFFTGSILIILAMLSLGSFVLPLTFMSGTKEDFNDLRLSVIIFLVSTIMLYTLLHWFKLAQQCI